MTESSNNLDLKIAAAMERLFTAYRILLWDRVKESNLSPLQLQFIIFLKDKPDNCRNVTSLALEFGLSKATVSQAVSSLRQKKIVSEVKSLKDRRSAILHLTPKGKKLATDLEIWNRPIQKILTSFPAKEKAKVFSFFIKLIEALRKEGIIKVAKMCVSCANFRKNYFRGRSKPHFCSLTERAVGEAELNIDCLHYHPF